MQVNLEDLSITELLLYKQGLKLVELLAAIKALTPGEGGPGGIGYPPNTDSFQVIRLPIALATTAYQGPDMAIPNGFVLVVKSAPTNAPAGYVRVAPTGPDSININSSWPLVPNEFVYYGIKNANALWFSGTVAGDFVFFTVERAP